MSYVTTPDIERYKAAYKPSGINNLSVQPNIRYTKYLTDELKKKRGLDPALIGKIVAEVDIEISAEAHAKSANFINQLFTDIAEYIWERHQHAWSLFQNKEAQDAYVLAVARRIAVILDAP